MVLPQAPASAGTAPPPCAAVVCGFYYGATMAADVSRINTTPDGSCDAERPVSSTGPRPRPSAAAVRAARSAPALPLRSVAAAADVTVDVAARQLRDLRFRATCSELVFEAVASVRDPFKRLDDYRTLMAVYAHPASPRGLLRCLSADRVAGLEKGVPASRRVACRHGHARAT